MAYNNFDFILDVYILAQPYLEPHFNKNGNSPPPYYRKYASENRVSIGLDNSVSSIRRQTIIQTNADLLSTGPLGTYVSEILIQKAKLSFTKLYLKISAAKWRPFRPLGDELTHWGRDKMAAISQTTFSKAFSWINMLEFRLKFHWSLFPTVQLIVFQHWFR